VSAVTVAALARVELGADGDWRYCSAADCDVAWFSNTTKDVVTCDESRVRFFDKETSEDRPVCYCFGFSVADVRAGRRADGQNTVAAAITQRCRRGEDRCAQTNPQGACCLGNVRGIRG
jgi:hypothetical protein